MSKGKSVEINVPQTLESIGENANGVIAKVFKAESVFRAVGMELARAKREAEFIAPVGYLISLVAKRDGSLSDVWEAHKPGSISYHRLKAGTKRYAPELSYGTFSGDPRFDVLRTTWINGPLDDLAYRDYPNPCIVNNDGVDIGLISIEEYRQRKQEHDETLHRAPESKAK